MALPELENRVCDRGLRNHVNFRGYVSLWDRISSQILLSSSFMYVRHVWIFALRELVTQVGEPQNDASTSGQETSMIIMKYTVIIRALCGRIEQGTAALFREYRAIFESHLSGSVSGRPARELSRRSLIHQTARTNSVTATVMIQKIQKRSETTAWAGFGLETEECRAED